METKDTIGYTTAIAVMAVFTAGLLDICSCSSCVSEPVVVKYSVGGNGSQPCAIASGSSTECSCCPNDTFMCPTLDAALNQLQCCQLSDAEITLGNVGSVILSDYQNISRTVDRLVLRGHGNTVVTCECNASISLEGMSNVMITDLTWKGCGGRGSSQSPVAAVSIVNCSNVTLSNVNFINSLGTAVSCANATFVMVNHTNFTNSMSIGLEIVGNTTLLSISSSCFVSNGNKTIDGGGVKINSDLESIIVQDTIFTDNQAENGGAIFATLFHGCLSNTSMTITNTKFTNNSARLTGGAIYCSIVGTAYYSTASTSMSQCFPAVVNCINCTFESNLAKITLAIFMDCEQHPTLFHCQLHLTKTSFESNLQATPVAYGYDRLGCTNKVKYINVTATDVNFTDNNASAMCLSRSNLSVEGMINFYNNQAFFGGALNIIGEQAGLLLNNDSVWNFHNNSAVYGGAIYQSVALSGLGPCIFKPGSEAAVAFPTESQIAQLNFRDNQATISGMSIYYNQPGSRCRYKNGDKDYYNMTFSPQKQDQNGSVATNITLFSNAELVGDATYTMSLILGQDLVFYAEVTDYFLNNSSAPVNVITQYDNIFFTSQLPNLKFNGGQVISINSGKTLTGIFFTGQNITSNQSDGYSLLLVGLIADSNSDTTLTINLNFTSCPLGWLYDPNSQMCACYDDAKVQCSTEDATACIEIGYWFGTVGKNTSTVAYCPAGFCSSTRPGGNQTCPNCPLPHVTGYCLLPSESINQCLEHRDSVTCSLCQEGYAFTYNAAMCVPIKYCSITYSFLLSLLALLFMVSLVVLMIIVLKVSYRLKSGYIYAFVYYFSILHLLIPFELPDKPIRVIVSIFESYTQLDPQFLGYIPLCFWNGTTALDLIPLQYLFPILASLCILSIIFFASRCPCKVRFIHFKDGSLVRTVTILEFLLFTSLTETSFRLLRPVTFDNTNATYVFSDPTIEYFHGRHAFWVVFAACIELFLITPFILVLFLAPFLMRFKRLKLVKLKPHLDEFQSCYKDEYRWMAFYYFFCRQLYLVALLSPKTDITPVQYSMQIISIAVAIFHTSLQPYADTWLNVLDTVILTDVVFVSILFGESGSVVFSNHTQSQNNIAYILIFIPIVYIVSLPFLLKLKAFLTQQCKQPYCLRSYAVSERTKKPSLVNTSYKDREPLIRLLHEDESLNVPYVPPQTNPRDSEGSSDVTESTTENQSSVQEIPTPERVRATSFFLSDGSVRFQVHSIEETVPKWKPVSLSYTKKKKRTMN